MYENKSKKAIFAESKVNMAMLNILHNAPSSSLRISIEWHRSFHRDPFWGSQ